MAVLSKLPVRRVRTNIGGSSELSLDEWPATIPAVAQLLANGIDLSAATVLVGENGTGKSTIVEAIAMAFGMSPEGGSVGAQHRTRRTESALFSALRLDRGVSASRWGFFLRAETMHGFYTYLEQNPSPRGGDSRFHEMSHGESFLEVLRRRFDGSGLFILDEPESALSFTGCLSLLVVLTQLLASPHSQVIVATHSPVVASLPGARILELDGSGFHERTWEELTLVQHHRQFLSEPEQYLRHVLADD